MESKKQTNQQITSKEKGQESLFNGPRVEGTKEELSDDELLAVVGGACDDRNGCTGGVSGGTPYSVTG
jgi:hypothetical protein